MVPGHSGVEVRGKDVVNNLGVEGCETVPVFLQVEGLLEASEGLGRLNYNKVVDLLTEGVETDLQPV